MAKFSKKSGTQMRKKPMPASKMGMPIGGNPLDSADRMAKEMAGRRFSTKKG